VSVNLSRVPPNDKERLNGSITDRFQVLYKEIPPLDSTQLSNLKELWEGIRKTGKPLEVIANCTVELPSVAFNNNNNNNNNTQSNTSHPSIILNPLPINSSSTQPSIDSTKTTTPSIQQPLPLSKSIEGSVHLHTTKTKEKFIPEIPINNNQPITNISSQSISVKSKQVTKSKLNKAPTPFQKFQENMPLFVQEFQISDYEDIRVLSWKGFFVIVIAFLLGKLFG